MINPKRELFKWGPIDGRPIYNSIWVRAFLKFPEYYNMNWVENYVFFSDEKVTYICDDKKLRDNAEIVFKKYMLNDKYKEYYDKWKKTTDIMLEFEKKVNHGTDKLDDSELAHLFIKRDNNHLKFLYYGYLPEFSNWGGERLLKELILKNYKKNFIEIFEALTAPENLSFYQLEEKELIELKLEFSEEKLKKHQKKYYWLSNSFAFTKVLDVEYFRKEMDKIENPKQKLEEINRYVDKTRKKKELIISKYSIPKEMVKIGDGIAYNVHWQDYRKVFIFIANHVITRILEEVSVRKKISVHDLTYYKESEIIDLLKENKMVDVKNRKKCFLMHHVESDELIYYEGEEAYKIIKPFIEPEFDLKQKELKGTVVSLCEKVIGKVSILDSPRNLNKMREGDILVAPMTSPDFIVAMRKARAIITDEGGITSHAAIVSRELGIPCIVGTRIATKLLKDGETVEVDTKEGVVRRIE